MRQEPTETKVVFFISILHLMFSRYSSTQPLISRVKIYTLNWESGAETVQDKEIGGVLVLFIVVVEENNF